MKRALLLSLLLLAAGAAPARWALVATSDTSFFSLRDYGTVRVVRGPSGQVERFDWGLGADVFPCPRVADPPVRD